MTCINLKDTMSDVGRRWDERVFRDVTGNDRVESDKLRFVVLSTVNSAVLLNP